MSRSLQGKPEPVSVLPPTSPEWPAARERYRNYLRLRLAYLLTVAVVAGLSLLPLAYEWLWRSRIHLGVLLVPIIVPMTTIFVGGMVILGRSRCPLCCAWVHPYAYPAPGRHCPKCGQKVPEDFKAL